MPDFNTSETHQQTVDLWRKCDSAKFSHFLQDGPIYRILVDSALTCHLWLRAATPTTHQQPHLFQQPHAGNRCPSLCNARTLGLHPRHSVGSMMRCLAFLAAGLLADTPTRGDWRAPLASASTKHQAWRPRKLGGGRSRKRNDT